MEIAAGSFSTQVRMAAANGVVWKSAAVAPRCVGNMHANGHPFTKHPLMGEVVYLGNEAIATIFSCTKKSYFGPISVLFRDREGRGFSNRT